MYLINKYRYINSIQNTCYIYTDSWVHKKSKKSSFGRVKFFNTG